MKLWLLSQDVSYLPDTIYACVVAAVDEERAKNAKVGKITDSEYSSTWVKPQFVKVEYLGEAKRGTKSGMILSCAWGGE